MSTLFSRKKSWNLLSAGILAAVLVGCSEDEATEPVEQPSTEQASEEAEVQQASTRTITDALGNEIEIPANPERIIATYLEDNLVALGITPVAQWSVNDGASIQGYLQAALKDVPTIPHDLPFEAVQSFNPDLIIMDSASMVEGDKYSQYSKLAPTYVIGEAVNNDWRDELTRVGEVFGKEDVAKQALSDYDTKASAAKEELKAKVGETSVAAVWLVSGSFFIVSDNLSSGAVMYGDLGLQVPEVVKEISASATGNWSAISLEKLVELDADHLFVINSDSPENPAVLSDALWNAVPAVKAGNVYNFSADTSWLYTGAIAHEQIIDHILESLIK